ncbi:MAG: phosphoenolpyruvate carboxykinase (ATP) [Negativicutes bacterium]|nr:phosphoenolpyruvate carboxykinase (ATP) [Negativicutes bacterium]
MDSLKKLGIHNVKEVYHNLSGVQLVEKALERNEGELTSTGAFSVQTGIYTGRSPGDRFIVDSPEVHEDIYWTSNQAISSEQYDRLYCKLTAYLQEREVFIFDGFVGADSKHRMPIRVVNEFAWQNLFVRNLFIRPIEGELETHEPEFTVICAPGFKANPEIDQTPSEAFIILNLADKKIIIGGTHYAGEMKKSIFSVLNYLLPKKGIFPMHCSANLGSDGRTALFFGLSGTGKTTLSANPDRGLIGDDEHGWSDQGVFNFEGGCYAKCIRLSQKSEPQIWDAIRFGTVVENVEIKSDCRTPDFDSEKYTENTRAAYPLDFIPGAIQPSIGGHPSTIIFLTADAFGVLPPVAKLTEKQAMYHFLSGYTSKLAGTERGITKPEGTFSTCFGAPFLPLHPLTYAEMLAEKMVDHEVDIYLVNTGWQGGPYGVGNRISIEHTRSIINAALSGELKQVEYKTDPIFNFEVPQNCLQVPPELLDPRSNWENKEEYDRAASELAQSFIKNFSKFSQIPSEIVEAGPQVQ